LKGWDERYAYSVCLTEADRAGMGRYGITPPSPENRIVAPSSPQSAAQDEKTMTRLDDRLPVRLRGESKTPVPAWEQKPVAVLAVEVTWPAAVIGMEVLCTLLQAVAEPSEAEIHQGLTELQAAEFLYEARFFPDLAYTFKHALTREVAYGSLLQERLHALQARIVEVIERLHADHLTVKAERLAKHAFRGEVWGKAAAYSWQASTRAFARSAEREVVVCSEPALAALKHVPESRAMQEQAHIELSTAIQLYRSMERTFWRGQAEAVLA
jgi:hypothetical protein